MNGSCRADGGRRPAGSTVTGTACLRPEAIAEMACAHAERSGFEASVLAELGRHIGFDVGFFCEGDGLSDVAHGFDESVRPAAAERWSEMTVESLELLPTARRSQGVVVDSEVFGERLERLVYYDTIMRPHRGRTTLMGFLECQGVLSGELVLGRCKGSPPFSRAQADALRRLMPVLSLSRHAYLGAGAAKAGAAPSALGPCCPRPPADDPVMARLTPREREVLGYLHLGYSNQQIALALGSAPRTVRNQLSRAYDKIGVGTRAEAVAWALGRRPQASFSR